jgi:hypothetical protein
MRAGSVHDEGQVSWVSVGPEQTVISTGAGVEGRSTPARWGSSMRIRSRGRGTIDVPSVVVCRTGTTSFPVSERSDPRIGWCRREGSSVPLLPGLIAELVRGRPVESAGGTFGPVGWTFGPVGWLVAGSTLVTVLIEDGLELASCRDGVLCTPTASVPMLVLPPSRPAVRPTVPEGVGMTLDTKRVSPICRCCPIVTTGPGESLRAAARAMRAVGVVSMRDLLGGLVQTLTPDAVHVMIRQAWCDLPENWLG